MARKKNYLNNSDMLKEIHKSKNSYCSFKNFDLDNQYDIIVDSIDEIFNTRNIVTSKDENGDVIMDDVPVISIALQSRADRLNKIGITTNIEDITIQDVVFRVNTTEHIPPVPKKKVKKKKEDKKDIFNDLFNDEDNTTTDPSQPTTSLDPSIEMVPMRAGFPPFFHYRLNEYNELYIVGKSHWKGDLDNGEFCKDHGQITENLAKMFMKLCERYGTRGNWRGYSYNIEMQGQALLQLAQVGLQFNEHKSLNPFSYFTQVLQNSFTKILNIEKKIQDTRDDILEENNLLPSWSRQYKNEHHHDNDDDKHGPVIIIQQGCIEGDEGIDI